jgi:hypothetical protein
MKDVYILNDKKYSNLLLYSSQLFFINSIIAYIYNLYDYSIISLCIYINSINYWRKPTISVRRNIDIVTNIISFIYHKYNLIYNINILSLIFIYVGIIFYILAIIMSKYNKIYISVIFHIHLHIFTNMSIIYHILYIY